MKDNATSNTVKSLSVEDFEAAFAEKLSPFVADRVRKYAFQYQEFTPKEHDFLLKVIVQALLDPNLVQAGEHRLDQWESGWGENLDLISNNPKDVAMIIPKYFNKYGAIRWCGRFIRPVSEQFEYRSLAVIQDWLFDKYLRDAPAIYEFGCGTGYNLLRARDFNPTATLWGLDWATASQQIIERLRTDGVDPDIHGHNFDYFNPDESFKLAPDAVIYSVASLEQVGSRWEKFVDYIIRNRPKLCVHIEPVGEMLDPDTLIDYLSIEYFKKRNYLEGFLDGLREMEKQGKVRIHNTQRSYIGSLFIEGYSVVVWSPV
jgi:hypothetical protein